MRHTLATLAVIVGIATQGPSTLHAKDSTPHDTTLVGSWFVTVTPTVMPAFVGLTTIGADGSVIETNALTLASSLESPGHGRWVRITAHRYALTFVNLEVNPDGSYAGTGKVHATVILTSSGQLTGTFEVALLDPNGVLLFSDSGTVSGKRIEVEP